MSLLNKTVSFLAVMACMSTAFAVTARLGVSPNVSSANSRLRMPTMTAAINSGTTTTTTTTTTSILLDNAECIEAYTACMKGGDTCGPTFEECTTKVLFHGKMAQCLGTLAQCNSSGINSLFGTSSVANLANVATTNSYGEVTDYTYPTDGSVLGQLITGAAITNKYDTATCVKRYTSCLKKDSVCGNDFELCTTSSEFRKQMVLCDSTLARCQSDGKIELFGSVNTGTAPSATSRIGEMIAEGAALAAVNAVSTCYKVVDQCILGACATNPYRCTESATRKAADLADAINNGNVNVSAETLAAITDTISSSAVSGYIKGACLDTIGSNKYCYATFLGEGLMPTASQLADADNQEEVYDEAYSARMNAAMKSKISDFVNKFDTKAKDKCVETIQTCAMRVCGGGMGAACYDQVFNSKDKSINNKASYSEIKTGCADIVNTDLNCKYAAANPNGAGDYSYAYIDATAFDTLFPEYDGGDEADPIGVIAALNANLATSYSDAAIAQMKKQCQSVATSCVKSLCGNDYINCYRNRTDIYSSLTNTGEDSFDKSMNKVGGVLDYTIVLGLCLDTVKNASVCEEHLAIEANKYKNKDDFSSAWGGASSVRGGWLDSGSATKVTAETETVNAHDENGNQLCTSKSGDQGVCYTVDAAGNVYDTPVTISYTNYIQSEAANSLFKELIYDLEKEAQAKYNAKLTKEQNMCMSNNSGGILGNKDMGSTYMWVKLKSNKVPKSYSTAGLADNQFVASNDLYGSFCRVRVTLQSDNKEIQDKLREGTKWASAYFALGDTFTCGSWIPSSALEEIANAVAEKKVEDKKESQETTRNWLTALGSVGGAVGIGFLGDSIATGKTMGGLTGLGDNRKSNEVIKKAAENCVSEVGKAQSALYSDSTRQSALTYARNAVRYAKTANVGGDSNSSIINDVNSGISVAEGKTTSSTVPSGIDAQITAAKNQLQDAQTKYLEENGKSIDDSYTAEMKKNALTVLQSQIDAAKSEVDRLTKLRDSATTSTTLGSVADLRSALDTLNVECQAKVDNPGKNEDGKRWLGSTIGTVVGAVGGGILLNKMVGDIQKSQLTKAQQEAYDEWMNNVGSHIFCYIGSEEAGTYGSIVGTSIE